MCCAAHTLRSDWDPRHATAACTFHDSPGGERAAKLMHAGCTHLRKREISKKMACHRCLLEAYDTLHPAADMTVARKRRETTRYVAFLATLDWRLWGCHT